MLDNYFTEFYDNIVVSITEIPQISEVCPCLLVGYEENNTQTTQKSSTKNPKRKVSSHNITDELEEMINETVLGQYIEIKQGTESKYLTECYQWIIETFLANSLEIKDSQKEDDKDEEMANSRVEKAPVDRLKSRKELKAKLDKTFGSKWRKKVKSELVDQEEMYESQWDKVDDLEMYRVDKRSNNGRKSWSDKQKEQNSPLKPSTGKKDVKSVLQNFGCKMM